MDNPGAVASPIEALAVGTLAALLSAGLPLATDNRFLDILLTARRIRMARPRVDCAPDQRKRRRRREGP